MKKFKVHITQANPSSINTRRYTEMHLLKGRKVENHKSNRRKTIDHIQENLRKLTTDLETVTVLSGGKRLVESEQRPVDQNASEAENQSTEAAEKAEKIHLALSCHLLLYSPESKAQFSNSSQMLSKKNFSFICDASRHVYLQ